MLVNASSVLNKKFFAKKSAKNFATLLLFLIGVFYLFSPPFDSDFGWHIKYGEYLFTNKEVLKENIFSYTFTDYKWANSYWFSQTIFYLFFKLFGTILGPILLSLSLSITMSFVIVKIFERIGVKQISAFISALALIIVFGNNLTTVRPLYFSSLFMFLLMYTLLFKQKYIYYFPILFLVWANMHADFILGLFVFGIYVLFEVVLKRKSMFNWPVTLLILSGLVTAINPFGINLHATLLKEAHPFQFQYISEWLPPKIEGDNRAYIAYFYLLIVLLPVSSWYLRKKFGLWSFFLVLMFSLFSIRAAYFYRITTIIGIFPLALFLDKHVLLFENSIYIQKEKIVKSLYFVLVFLLVMSATSFVFDLVYASEVKKWSAKKDFPYDEVLIIREQNLKGNIFNNYGWGGYLIWQLPEKKTFIDGRMPSWRENGTSVFEDYINIKSDPKRNSELFENYASENDIKIIIDKHDSKLVKHLMESENWSVYYKDDNSVLLVKEND